MGPYGKNGSYGKYAPPARYLRRSFCPFGPFRPFAWALFCALFCALQRAHALVPNLPIGNALVFESPIRKPWLTSETFGPKGGSVAIGGLRNEVLFSFALVTELGSVTNPSSELRSAGPWLAGRATSGK